MFEPLLMRLYTRFKLWTKRSRLQARYQQVQVMTTDKANSFRLKNIEVLSYLSVNYGNIG